MALSSGIFFIAGPTASGKSGLAVRLAKETGGEIVNADAIQVYRDLKILSARPGEADQQGIPHHLYGYLDGAHRCSAGQWARKAAPVIEEILNRKRCVFVVGGTGLYFRALEEGLSPIPDISDQIRVNAQKRFDELGQTAFYDEVLHRDPGMAWLVPQDSQRLMRAWSVYEATGKPLSFFQSIAREPLLTVSVTKKLVLLPEREDLYAQCEARFDSMLALGGLDEAQNLLARDLPEDLPVMKALGAAELMDYLKGRISLETAIELAKRNTRRFIKRQITWFRGQAADWEIFDDPDTAL